MPGTSLQGMAGDREAPGGARGHWADTGAVVPGMATPPQGEHGRHGVVVVDATPLYRSGAVAALLAAGVPVVGEAGRMADGVTLANQVGAAALVVGGAEAAEVEHAVNVLAGCAVVALLAEPSRSALVQMLGTGVAGLGPRSLTAEELVSTVQAAVEALGKELDGASTSGGTPVPAFVPVPLSGPREQVSEARAPDGTRAGVVLTPKEQEILALLAQGASNKRISEALYVTQATVKTHLAHIYAKLGARGRHEAISRAFAQRLLR